MPSLVLGVTLTADRDAMVTAIAPFHPVCPGRLGMGHTGKPAATVANVSTIARVAMQDDVPFVKCCQTGRRLPVVEDSVKMQLIIFPDSIF